MGHGLYYFAGLMKPLREPALDDAHYEVTETTSNRNFSQEK
jgi:hypothetical protein